jgi:hypothetical protein
MSITPMPPAKAKGARFQHGSVLGGKTRAAWVSSQWKSTPQGKNCHVDVRGKYADGKSADVSDIDICADKTVDLVN